MLTTFVSIYYMGSPESMPYYSRLGLAPDRTACKTGESFRNQMCERVDLRMGEC